MRVCFVLGNLSVNSDENRLMMCKTCNALDILIPLFAKYNNVDMQNEENIKNGTIVHGSAGASVIAETEQVLVKVSICGEWSVAGRQGYVTQCRSA